MKKIISVLTTLVLLLSMINVSAQDTVSLADGVGLNLAVEYSGVTLSGSTAGSPSNGAWLRFENVDFGKTGIAQFMVNVALADGYVGAALKFYVDNESSPFAELVVPTTGGWGKWAWAEATVVNEAVTGVHEVTMRYTSSGPGDIKGFKMVPIKDETGPGVPETVTGTPFEDKYEILSALDIINWDGESTFNLDEEISVLTFVDAAMMLKGEDDSSKVTDFITECGLVSGDKITVEKACEVLVKLLNYHYAMLNGETIMVMAEQIEIDYDGKPDDFVTWQNAINMLYSATEISPAVIVPKNIGGDKSLSTLEVYENNTMLIEHRDIYKSKGILTMNSATGLDDVSNINDNQVLIGEYIFDVGNANVSGLLGYAVEYYFHEGDFENTLVYIRKSERNKVTELNAKDILSYQNRRVRYMENNKEKFIDFPSNTKLIYNGLAVSKFNDTMFNMNNGSMEIIDNDNDSTPEVVKLWNTTDYMTDGVFDDILYLRTAQNDTIDLDGVNVKVELQNAVGKAILPSKIRENTVVTVAKAEAVDGSFTLYTVTNSANTASGYVKAINLDKETIKIDDEEYPLSTAFANGSASSIVVGSSMKVYLNKYGEVAFADVATAAANMIGYTVKAYEDDEENVWIRIFNEDGEMNDYMCYEKIYIDGVKATDPYNALKDRKELVVFSTNAVGQVRKLNFALPENNARADNGLYHYFDANNLQYKANTGNVGGLCMLSSNFIKFKIPADATDYDNYEVTAERFVNDSRVTMKCYNTVQDKLDISIGVENYTPASPSVSTTSDIYYVADKKEGLNGDNEEVVLLTYYNGKNKELVEREVSVSNSSVANSLKAGDGIRFTINKNDEIVGLTRIFSPADSAIYSTQTDFASVTRIIGGNVYMKQDGLLQVGAGGEVLNCETAAVYVVDGDDVSIGSLNDIMSSKVNGTGSEIYVYLKYGEVISLVIKN